MRIFAIAFVATSLVSGAPPSAVAQGAPSQQLKSGFETMGPDTQAMQLRDAENPAMLWVREGEKLWHEQPASGVQGNVAQSCAGCHGDAPVTMKSVAGKYPLLDRATQKPIDLSGRIRQCRSERQGAPELSHESRSLLALASYIGLQSRGDAIASPVDPELAKPIEAGKAMFNQRIGQLNLSCAACHDDQWGKKLGGSLIPQGHANGYPLYRLEWQNVGSLQRRIRNCMTGVRAEPLAYGDPAMIELELYLKARGAGLKVETPAVRP